ncbi:MAG TPA: ImmA/IrrE family metallo-endopeptidase [Thermoanaerobaculia bacterium]|nr:ImmA/IrrE family metallo-endopeptidase [Thermoanaerobaculia bacterium]
MSEQLFNPHRLRLARERAGWSIIELAREIDVSPRQVSNYERGASAPSEQALQAIVEKLRFPKEFYFRDGATILRDENATFRSLRRTTAAQRNQVLALGSLAMELSNFIELSFNLPAVDLPDMSDYRRKPEAAADALRALWGLDQKPVANSIALLEFHGVRVFSLAEELHEVNAVSVWARSRPFVFLNTMKSAEASRFDAMHELAHLVLHREESDPREAESEANAFAAAMLMPASDVLAVTPSAVTMKTLIKLKRRWGVSLSALAHRIHELGIIGPWPYRNLCIEIGRSGYRTNEPNAMDRETSRILAKVLAELRNEGVTLTHLANALAIPTDELKRLIFGLAIIGVDGGGGRVAGARKADRTTNLREV